MRKQSRIWLSLIIVVASTLFFQLSRMDLFFGGLNAAVNQPQAPGQNLPYVFSSGESALPAFVQRHYRFNRALLVDSSQTVVPETENLMRILDNLAFECDRVDPSRIVDAEFDFEFYDLIVLLSVGPVSCRQTDSLIEAVRAGSRLLVLYDAENQSNDIMASESALVQNAGIVDIYDTGRSASLDFVTELIPSIYGQIELTGETMAPFPYFAYRKAALAADCQVHLTDNVGNPLIWQRGLLNGQLLWMNTGHYASRYMTGLLTGAILALLDLVVYPVAAAKTLFVDDFPADYAAELPLLRREYGRDYERYILEIWWPQMNALARQHHLKLNAACLFSFDSKTSYLPAVTQPDKTTQLLLYELLQAGGEICLHGYNHQPLCCQDMIMAQYGCNAWPDIMSAAASLDIAAGCLSDLAPAYLPQVYIPPSDLFSDDPALLEAMLAAVPSLCVLSGIYYEPAGKEGKSEDFLVQDFGMQYCAERQLVCLPRISAGPNLTDEGRYLIASAALAEGVISHTVLPDDVLDPYRSQGRSCEELMRSYGNLFNWFDVAFPLFESMTASEAAQAVAASELAAVLYTRSDDRLSLWCESFTFNQAVIVKIKAELSALEGCTAKKLDSSRWLIRLTKPQALLEVN